MNSRWLPSLLEPGFADKDRPVVAIVLMSIEDNHERMRRKFVGN